MADWPVSPRYELSTAYLVKEDDKYILRVSVDGKSVDLIMRDGMFCNIVRDAAVFMADEWQKKRPRTAGVR